METDLLAVSKILKISRFLLRVDHILQFPDLMRERVNLRPFPVQVQLVHAQPFLIILACILRRRHVSTLVGF